MSFVTARRNTMIVSVIFVLLINGLLLNQILAMNDGQFSYLLDDAYIHLAVAEEITNGGYGINSAEYSSPSSSILWPMMMVPFVWLGIDEFGPLLVNTAAACLTAALFVAILFNILDQPGSFFRRRSARWFVYGVVAGLVLITDTAAMAFSGMEHTVQVLLSVMVLWGLLRERDTGEVSFSLQAALVLGPLIRYENLVLTATALVVLMLRGHARIAIRVAVLTVIPIIAFSLFLHLLDLRPLPNSALVKSTEKIRLGGIDAVREQLQVNLSRQGGKGLLMLILLLSAYLFAHRPDSHNWQLAWWGAVTGGAHLFLFRTGWVGRYELYLWTVLLLILVIVTRQFWNNILKRYNLAAVSVALLAIPYTSSMAEIHLQNVTLTPLGANNIYEQQHQMHRFATEFYDGPVAVNDLGWVSYQNDHYVLDLWGLGHFDSFQHRHDEDVSWMNEFAANYDVQLAMIYDNLFEAVPENWTRVAELYLSQWNYTPADDCVVFYALNPDDLPFVQAALDAFALELPGEVRLVREFDTPEVCVNKEDDAEE